MGVTAQYGIWIMVRSLLLVCLFITFGFSKAVAEEKIFEGWVLHMFLSGQLTEYTPRGGMSECLSVKRKILRSQGEAGARWECRQGKLRLRRYDGGVDGEKWLAVEHLGH